MLEDSRLPTKDTPVPFVRENRLYQADWLMRFYQFEADEILDRDNPFLDLECDPKLAWAIRNKAHFPVCIQTAPYRMILRIPGVGVRSAKKIVQARKFTTLTLDDLKKFGVATNRAKYFVAFRAPNPALQYLQQDDFRQIVLNDISSKFRKAAQLDLFA